MIAQKVRPITRILATIGELPTSYLISMTYEEQLIWLCNYLEQTVIPAINNNADAVKEVQDALVELKEYVDNYFESLDLQEEIDKALQKMIDEGTLQEIIIQFLELGAILCFDTVNDMKNATNLMDGTICRTLGYYDKDDFGGSYYKITTISTDDIRTIELDNGLYAITMLNSNVILGNTLGLYADKNNDDCEKLQAIIDYCKEYELELQIKGYCYVSDTIDTKGIKISGVGQPATAYATYTSKTYGYLGWDYLRNANDGALITFEDYGNDILTSGSGIISDVADPILTCKHKDGKFLLENLTICGWIRTPNQEGVKSTYENDDNYISGHHKLKNVNIINCGGNGLHIQSLEGEKLDTVQCVYNFGYGVYIEGVDGKDTPFEYVEVKNCTFNGNKRGGFYAKNTYRKHVSFIECNATFSGLYKQLNLPLPTTTEDLVFGFKIEGKESSKSTPRNILIFDRCYGEETNKLIELELNGNSTAYSSNNITITNNVCYPTEVNDICCLLKANLYYSQNFSYYNNIFNGNNQFIPQSTNMNVIPLLVDSFYPINNLKTPTISSKLNVSTFNIKRDGNLINMNIVATASDNIPAYENIISN